LWSDLKGSVDKCRPATIKELWRTCEDKRAQIPLEKIRKLCESLPRRIEEVIKMKGRNTHYGIGEFQMSHECIAHENACCNFLLQ